MNVTEIVVGHRVLVQSSTAVKEHAKVLGITYNGFAVVRLADGNVVEIAPYYILKDFGS